MLELLSGDSLIRDSQANPVGSKKRKLVFFSSPTPMTAVIALPVVLFLYRQNILQSSVVKNLRPIVKHRDMTATKVGVRCLHRIHEPHQDTAQLLCDIGSCKYVDQLF